MFSYEGKGLGIPFWIGNDLLVDEIPIYINNWTLNNQQQDIVKALKNHHVLSKLNFFVIGKKYFVIPLWIGIDPLVDETPINNHQKTLLRP